MLLKIGPFDLIFRLTCRPWSCLLYCFLWYSLHCVVVEQFANLKKIPGFARCPASSLLGVGTGRAYAPNKEPGLYAWGEISSSTLLGAGCSIPNPDFMLCNGMRVWCTTVRRCATLHGAVHNTHNSIFIQLSVVINSMLLAGVMSTPRSRTRPRKHPSPNSKTQNWLPLTKALQIHDLRSRTFGEHLLHNLTSNKRLNLTEIHDSE